MKKCKACGREYRKGTRAWMFVGGRLAGAIVCVPCGNGGAVLVPAKLPPVVEHKTRRHFEGRAEGLEVAIETVKRFAGGES